jgi:hypothetical protein
LKRLALLLSAALVVVLAAGPAAAQEVYEEYDGTLDVVTRREVPLRGGPSDRTQMRRMLPAGTRLRLLEMQTSGGYHRVTAPGMRGWVWADGVRFDEGPADRMRRADPGLVGPSASRPGPCLDVSDVRVCPASGCAEGDRPVDKAEALLNEAKHGVRLTGVRARTIDFAFLLALQERATVRVGQGGHLQADERAALRRLGEGRLVRLAGFLARDRENPRQAGPESVNCRLPRVENNDFHINIAPTAGGEEFDGVVVEMTPDRPERLSGAWTRAKLSQAKREGRMVMAEGQLFYDNRHLVRRRQDTGTRFRNQPKRISLWEIHPVTRFFVCRRTNNACDPRQPRQWTALENF